MGMDQNEVLSLALLAAKAGGGGCTGGAGGAGWTVRQVRMLESILNAVTYTDQTAQDTADALILSLLASVGGSTGESEIPGGDPETPGSEPEAPGGEPETPGSEPETPGGEPETPGSGTQYCTSAVGERTLTASKTTLPSVVLTPESGTVFAQEPNKLTIRYISGAIPTGHKLYSAVLLRDGNSWTVSSIRNGYDFSNLKPGNTVSVTWEAGWTTVTVTALKANLVTTDQEMTISFGGTTTDPTLYRVTAEVV